MTPEQLLVLSTLFLALFLSIQGKYRYDVVGGIALLLLIAGGVYTTEEAFRWLAHDAVVIVAAMFVISRALISSGLIDSITRRLFRLNKHPIAQLFFLLLVVAVLSGFVNNVGALVFMMPIAIRMARDSGVSPAMFLLPLAFASHIGGYLTLIGTPRNIIVSAFRQQETGTGFAMFDFLPVGVGIFIISMVFLSVFAWRKLPKRRRAADEDAFAIDDYITEVTLREDSAFLNRYIKDLREETQEHFRVLALIRDHRKIMHPSGYEILREGDALLIQADPTSLSDIIEANHFYLVGEKAVEKNVTNEDNIITMEVVVHATSRIVGRAWHAISLQERFGVNLLAISRRGKEIKTHIEEAELAPGDVLLLHGREESIGETVNTLGLLPLAKRDLALGRSPKIFLPTALFGLTIVAAAFNIVPLSLLFVATALLMILFGFLSLEEAYASVEWPVLLLLGSMIAVGSAMQRTGIADVIAESALALPDIVGPAGFLLAVLVFAMVLSDVVNANAAAVIMSPIAITVAGGLGVSIDPFLMAVAVGSSTAFLTPYGHESNALVLNAGKYAFSDFIKVGLPLEILIALASVPLILTAWPL